MLLCRFDNLRNSSVFTQFILSAALLQAMLQTNRDPLRKGLVEMKNRAVELRSGTGTFLVALQFLPKRSAISSHPFCNYTVLKFYLNNCFFQWFFWMLSTNGKSFRSVFHAEILCVGAGSNTLMSIAQWLGPYIFCPKTEKAQLMRKKTDGRVFISCQSWQFFFVVNTFKVYLYLDLVCQQLCFPPRKMYSWGKKRVLKRELTAVLISWLSFMKLVARKYKIFQISLLLNICPLKDVNFEKKTKAGSRCRRNTRNTS